MMIKHEMRITIMGIFENHPWIFKTYQNDHLKWIICYNLREKEIAVFVSGVGLVHPPSDKALDFIAPVLIGDYFHIGQL